jgi:uncharacterized membrane protein YdbT with pleckstrin-like domain
MDSVLNSMIEKDEKILWSGRGDLMSTIMHTIGFIAIFVAIGSLLYFVFGNLEGGTCRIMGKIRPVEECNAMARNISLIFFGIAALIPILTYFGFKATEYAISDKRFILKSGMIGADIRSVYYNEIRSIYVVVGLVGKIFSTGTIKIDTGRTKSYKKNDRSVTQYDKINNIKNPYEVYKILQNNIADSKENSPSENSNSDSENTDVKMPAELKKITDTVNKGMKFFQIVPKIIFMFVVVWMAYQFYIQFMSH